MPRRLFGPLRYQGVEPAGRADADDGRKIRRPRRGPHRLGLSRRRLRRAWQQVLFYQFHDILAGTSLEAAYEDARDMLGEAMAIADRTLNTATQSLAWNIVVPRVEDTNPLVVFNPHAWPSRADRRLRVRHSAGRPGARRRRGQPPCRSSAPSQRLQCVAVTGSTSLRICPHSATGYIGSCQGASAREPRDRAGRRCVAVSAGDNWLENERFRLEFDPETGLLKSLYDKAAGVEALAGPAAAPVSHRGPQRHLEP